MPTTDQLDAAAPRSVLLTLTYGASSTARYVIGVNNLTIGADTFNALPECSISDLKITGSLDAESITITLAAEVAPFNAFIAQDRHSTIRCKFEVVDPADTATRREYFYGTLVSASPEDDEDESLYQFRFDGIKAFLKQSITLKADNYCNVYLGHPACGIDTAAVTLTGTLSTIGTDGIANRVTVTFGGSPDLSDGRWRTGTLAYDGLALGILAGDGTGKFDLEFPAPASWSGQTVTAKPGCDGRLTTCRNTWNNEANFVGYGVDMPDKFPLTEIA